MRLETEIQSIIDASGAEMGVSIHHLESGEEVNINADASYPMCSVLKIPVLCEAFRQIDAGHFTLDDRWELTLAEKNLPSGVLVFLQDGLRPTVRDLLTLMIIISDNTATDMVMNRLGVGNINSYMHKLGLMKIHVSMTIRDIFDDLLGDAADPMRVLSDLDKQKVAPDANRIGRAYSTGPDNDVSTAREMTRLLTMIARGTVVSREACGEMLHILLQQQINIRLPRFLPYGVPFAHKTGTLSGLRNDAGILYANEQSHVVVSVFSRWDAEAVMEDPVAEDAQIQRIDSAFGQIGLALYNAYKGHHRIFLPLVQNQPKEEQLFLPYIRKGAS